MNIDLLKKRWVRNTGVLLIVGTILVSLLVFLHSIRFRLDYYFFDFSRDTHDVTDFDEHREGFERLVQEVQGFVESSPTFFEEFDGYCTVNNEGLVFYKNGVSYPDNQVVYAVDADGWDTARRSFGAFPTADYFRMYVDSDYPNYVVFPPYEESPRFFIYTGGERPTEIIDNYWNRYEFVRVIKLANGWYDIRPIGRKDVIQFH